MGGHQRATSYGGPTPCIEACADQLEQPTLGSDVFQGSFQFGENVQFLRLARHDVVVHDQGCVLPLLLRSPNLKVLRIPRHEVRIYNYAPVTPVFPWTRVELPLGKVTPSLLRLSYGVYLGFHHYVDVHDFFGTLLEAAHSLSSLEFVCFDYSNHYSCIVPKFLPFPLVWLRRDLQTALERQTR